MSNTKIRKLRKEAAKYKYSGGRSFGVSADVAGQELHRIAKERGHITSQVVVDEARPEDAPLHPAFEWDDEKAAERFRLVQASTLVRAVVVVSSDASTTADHRAYMLTKIDTETKAVYVDAQTVVDSPSMFADALTRLEKRLGEAQSSVRELQNLAQQAGAEPERMARIGLAIKAIEAAGTAVAGLH